MSVQSPVHSVEDLRCLTRRLRCHVVRMITEAKSGHPGGSLSAAELITALYFGGVLRHDPTNPQDPNRDRLNLPALADASAF